MPVEPQHHQANQAKHHQERNNAPVAFDRGRKVPKNIRADEPFVLNVWHCKGYKEIIVCIQVGANPKNKVNIQAKINDRDPSSWGASRCQTLADLKASQFPYSNITESRIGHYIAKDAIAAYYAAVNKQRQAQYAQKRVRA